MTLAGILTLIQGVLAFPNELLALVKLLQGTPEAQREALMTAVATEADNFQKNGRPQW